MCCDYGLELPGEAGGSGPLIRDSFPIDFLKAHGNVDIPRGELYIKSPRDIFQVTEFLIQSAYT